MQLHDASIIQAVQQIALISYVRRLLVPQNEVLVHDLERVAHSRLLVLHLDHLLCAHAA